MARMRTVDVSNRRGIDEVQLREEAVGVGCVERGVAPTRLVEGVRLSVELAMSVTRSRAEVGEELAAYYDARKFTDLMQKPVISR